MVKYNDFKRMEKKLFNSELTQGEWNYIGNQEPGLLLLMLHVCDRRAFGKNKNKEIYNPTEILNELHLDLWGKTNQRNKPKKIINHNSFEKKDDDDDWQQIHKRMNALVKEDKKKKLKSIKIHEGMSIWD